MLLPDELFLSHLATPARLTHTLRAQGVEVDEEYVRGVECRLAGNAKVAEGDVKGAVEQYTKVTAQAWQAV